MRWFLAVAAFLVVGVAGWTLVPSRDGDMLGEPGGFHGVSMDSYDGLANVVILSVDIRNRTAKAQADIWLRGMDSYGDVVDFSVVNWGTSRLVASGVPLDSSGWTKLPPFEVPLTGGPSSAYPHDRYHMSMRLDVAVPEGVQLPPLVDASRLDRRLLLAVNYVSLDGNFTDWALQANSDKKYPYYESRAFNDRISLIHPIHLIIARPTADLAFIYSILSTPVLLAFAFVLAFLVARRDPTRGADAAKVSPLEFAAALIAVITLRQVLVPTDVAGFTTLDKILGIQVAAITAAVIFMQALGQPKRPEEYDATPSEVGQ